MRKMIRAGGIMFVLLMIVKAEFGHRGISAIHKIRKLDISKKADKWRVRPLIEVVSGLLALLIMLSFAFGAASICGNAYAAVGDISTFAGGGAGDGGAATSVNLSAPTGVAVDSLGNIYIADRDNHRIRMVNPSGVISTVAGYVSSGYSGDGGVATSAKLRAPTGVAVDSLGNIYIADRDNHRIRMVNTSGVISTVAGNGNYGYSGDSGAATSAKLGYPEGVAVDSLGNIYIADTYNNRIRMVNPSGVISTVAGNGSGSYSGDSGAATSASLNYPKGVAVDSLGNVYIADTYNNRIRMVNPSGVISTVAGNGSGSYSGDGGAATSASFTPYGVAVDSSGNMYIADYGNHRIRKVNPSGVISTVAGNGSGSYSGDGGAATSARLNYPYGVAVDSSGNVYIADYSNNSIRKVDPSGVINTVAGNGTYGYSGDGGAATSASLNDPYGVAFDSLGNMFIADYGNHRIRKVDSSGVISTFAGNGSGNFSGDGGAATSARLYSPSGVAVDFLGNIYIADCGNNRIRKVDPSGVISTVAGNGTAGYSGDGGAATSARLNYPRGVAVDSLGNIYIADTYNHRIRKVDSSGVISTFAGNGSGNFSGDGGAATSASLKNPFGVAVDSLGNIYIADGNNNRIRKVDTSGVISTFAGNGTAGYSGNRVAATSASLDTPMGVTIDSSGNVYIADRINHRIRKVTTSGIIITIAGNGNGSYSGDSGTATSAGLYWPSGVAVDSSGNVYIADTDNHRIRKVEGGNPAISISTDRGGTVTCSPNPVAMDSSSTCTIMPLNGFAILGVTVDGISQGVITNYTFTFMTANHSIGASFSSNVISTIAGNGTAGYSGDGGAAISASLKVPSGVAVDSLGNIYIADRDNYRIRMVNTSGVISTVAGNGNYGYSGDSGAATSAKLGYPEGVAVDSLGNIYIADYANSRIRKVNTSGVISTIAGNGTAGYSGDGGAATSASLNYPKGVAVDSLGNVYIADTYNNRIRMVNPSGVISTVAGNGSGSYSGDSGAATSASLNYPKGVAVDSLGNVYIADTYNNRIRMVNAAGVISTIAGNGSGSYSGDGGAATSASINQSQGVAVDFSGNVYIADTYNNRIRMVNAAGVISTIAGNGSAGYSGDGGAATLAKLSAPYGVAVDFSGNMYIADSGNHRIRKVTGATGDNYSISISASIGGTVTCSPNPVLDGSSSSCVMTLATGHHIVDVVVDGSSVGAVTSYTFNNVTTNHTISATFSINAYTVTPTAGSGGTINPSTPQMVNYNTTTSFTVTPNTGYHISSVTGCGGTLSSNTFTTEAITSDCTVSVTFAIKTYTLTTSVGSGGTISPSSPQTVNYNATTSLTVTPNTGYHIISVSGCNGSLSGNTYTTGPITSDCTVSAFFATDTYIINASVSGDHGTISCTPVMVSYGESSVCTITPDNGYYLSSLTDNGIPVTGYMVGNTYTFSNITADHSNIVATFAEGNSTINIPRTGQTKCYNASGTDIECIGTGQDGAIQAGMEWPNPRFMDNGDQTMTDNLTGLIWPNDAGTPTINNCLGGTKTWQDAMDYVACINTNNYLGYNDWRLPNVNELESIASAQQYNPALPEDHLFINTQATWYWTSTTRANITGDAWMVDIGNSEPSCAVKSSNRYVLPVRDGQSGIKEVWRTGQTTSYYANDDGAIQKGIAWPSPRFTENNDSTITDWLTGLIWTKIANTPGPAVCNPGQSKLWQAALDYIDCLNSNNYLGYNDWRLPNSRERRSLADYSVGRPAIQNGHPFESVNSDFGVSGNYWSSTTRVATPSIAFTLAMHDGNMSSGIKSSNSYSMPVWPVRGGTVIANTAPVSESGGPYVTNLGIGITFDGTGSHDLDAGDSIVNYSWNIAGGTYTLSGSNPSLTASQVNALGAGTFAVVLTVTDSRGATGTASTTLTVNTSFFTIAVVSGAGGNVNCIPNPVNYGSSSTCTITPIIGYHIAAVIIDGVLQNPDPSTYTFNNVTSNHTISATFAINAYAVTPTAGAGGTISPNIPQTVNYNSTIAFTITPNIGYHIVSITGCGGTLAGNTFTTGIITGDCTVEAAFALNQYNLSVTINPLSTGGGTVGGNGTFDYGTTHNITAIADTGSTFTGWTGDCNGTASPYNVTMFDRDMTCTATFTRNQYTVNGLSTGNGSVSCSSPVDYNTQTTCNITADLGYHIRSVSGCGGTWTGTTPYTTGNITGDCDVTGTFEADPANIEVTPLTSPLSFGDTHVGQTSSAKTFTVSNTGNMPLGVGTVVITGTDFGKTNDNCTGQSIASAGSCTFQVTFNPSGYGPRIATLSIPSDDADTSEVSLTLEGTGIASNIGVLPASPVSFGSTAVGSSSAAQQFTISNTGNENLELGTIATDNVLFAKGNDACSGTALAPGETCIVEVIFTPETYGAEAAILSIPSNDPDTPIQNIALTATGTASNIGISPASPVDFGSINAGYPSPARQFTVINTGNAELMLGIITSSNPEYVVQNDLCSNSTIAANTGTCTFEVVLTPEGNGTRTANLSIPSNDPDATTVIIALNGNGIQYTVTGIASGYGTVNCQSPVNYNSSAICDITPGLNYHIVSVNGCGGSWSGSSPFITGNITGDCEVIATFNLTQHTLTVSTSGTGSGTVTGGGTYGYGTSHDIIVTADMGSTFTGWTGDCSGTANPYNVTMLDRDMTCTAIILDTTAPVLSGIVNQTLEATSASGATATFNVTASDLVDLAPVVTCSHISGSTFGLGTTTVNCTAKDSADNTSTGSFNIIVRDTTPPVVTPPADITADATGLQTEVAIGTATATDAVGVVSITNNAPATFAAGTTIVTWTARDAAGNAGTAIQNITLNYTTPQGTNVVVNPIDSTTGNAPVTITFANVTAGGISSVTTSGTGTPPPIGFKLGAPPIYYEISTTAIYSGSITICIDYSGSAFGNESALKLFHRKDSNWVNVTYSIDIVNNIICGNVDSLSPFAVFEEIIAPTVGDITAPIDPVRDGTEITVSAPFTDPGILDTHTATWNWGDGTTSAGIVTEADGSGTVQDTHIYAQAGVYTITLTVTDKDGASGSAVFHYVVVYDPDGGFVTGGGWINSPTGAYVPNPSLTGKATFGFVSKYKKGANVPTGNTEFQFKVANLNFHSETYQWLVVAGAKAQYKGTGTINNQGNYGFILTAIDGDLKGTTDKFRIKIWDKNNNDTIVYDNQLAAPDNSDPTTVISGGSIVIHKQ